MEQLT
jgi:tryptophanyl-tRNA synthetase